MSFAILNSDGDHLGFLLLAGEGDSGDCIFRSLPAKSELFDSEPSEVLYYLQEQGEFSWRRHAEQIEVSGPSQVVVASINDQVLLVGRVAFKVVPLNAS